MKWSVVFLSVAVAFFVIGIHQSFYFGISMAYPLFMIAVFFLLTGRYLRQHRERRGEEKDVEGTSARKKKRKHRK